MLSEQQREEAVKQLREVCRDIGCTQVSKSCHTHPHLCSIIQKIFKKGTTDVKVIQS